MEHDPEAGLVNVHMIEHVPVRKTDRVDSEWQAVLARFGLVRPSAIPPKSPDSKADTTERECNPRWRSSTRSASLRQR